MKYAIIKIGHGEHIVKVSDTYEGFQGQIYYGVEPFFKHSGLRDYFTITHLSIVKGFNSLTDLNKYFKEQREKAPKGEDKSYNRQYGYFDISETTLSEQDIVGKIIDSWQKEEEALKPYYVFISKEIDELLSQCKGLKDLEKGKKIADFVLLNYPDINEN
jgi:hypothetical protein